jgi:acetylornithine deacetylase
VAETLTFEGRFGIAVGENSDTAKRDFEAMVAKVAGEDAWLREHPPVVEWWGGQFESAGISPTEPIVQTTSQAFADITGEPPVLRGMPYGADMRLLVNNGNVPTMMFGTRGIRTAHQPDEHVPIADLETVIRTLVLTILRFCGTSS